jgi:hypothetical protein
MGGKRRLLRAAVACAAAVASVQPAAGPAAAAELRPSQLVGTWSVRATGVDPAQVLLMRPGSLEIPYADGRCHSIGSWEADRSGVFLGNVWGGQGSGCATAAHPWLEAAAAYAVDGERRQLLDLDGAVLAVLVPEGPRPKVRPAEREALDRDSVPPPPGMLPATRELLIGRWMPVRPAHRTYLQLHASGDWEGGQGCTGGDGRWGIGPGGSLVTSGPGAMNLVYCPNPPVVVWFAEARWAGFLGPMLVLVDADGKVLGHLVPDRRPDDQSLGERLAGARAQRP